MNEHPGITFMGRNGKSVEAWEKMIKLPRSGFDREEPGNVIWGDAQAAGPAVNGDKVYHGKSPLADLKAELARLEQFEQQVMEGENDEGPLVEAVPDQAGSPEYLRLLETMADLHRRKNAGYAGGKADPWDNFRECEDFGVPAFVGVLVRLSDKWKRIKSLQRNPANDQVGESKRDTLMDLAAYALIAVCLLDEQTGRDGNVFTDE